MTGGRTAPELGAKTPAAEEIAGVWRDVKSCFHEKMKAPKQVWSVANG
jgi:chromosome partitioning protein